MQSSKIIWVLTDDRAGNVAQALGVAEALGRDFVQVPIRYNPLARLPNVLTGASLIGLAPETRMTFGPQISRAWPDVVIAAGRRTAPIARWIKLNARKPVLLAQIMYPGSRGAADFDLIAVPRHDGEDSTGDAANVMRITGAPHRLTAPRLTSAADAWRACIAHLPKPHIALIVGGATHSKPFPADLARDLGAEVSRMAAAAGGAVLFASSRRTGADAEGALISALTVPHHAFLWSRGGDNPYVGFLALADAIVVTGDSVSMCSEACATAAPVYIYAPAGMVTAKHARLHRHLYDATFARPFDGTFTPLAHPPLNAADEIAHKIEDLIRRHFP